MDSEKKRKVVCSQGRQIIAKVYHFLKAEYEFTELHREPNCDISHLRNITQRTAEATGVSERTVQKILKEERDMSKESDGCNTSSNCFKPKRNRKKKDDKEEPIAQKIIKEERDTSNEEDVGSISSNLIPTNHIKTEVEVEFEEGYD